MARCHGGERGRADCYRGCVVADCDSARGYRSHGTALARHRHEHSSPKSPRSTPRCAAGATTCTRIRRPRSRRRRPPRSSPTSCARSASTCTPGSRRPASSACCATAASDGARHRPARRSRRAAHPREVRRPARVAQPRQDARLRPRRPHDDAARRRAGAGAQDATSTARCTSSSSRPRRTKAAAG